MPAIRKKSAPAVHPSPIDALPPRRRAILIAAVGVLMEKGYARASTLEIATRAKHLQARALCRVRQQARHPQALIALDRRDADAADAGRDRRPSRLTPPSPPMASRRSATLSNR